MLGWKYRLISVESKFKHWQKGRKKSGSTERVGRMDIQGHLFERLTIYNEENNQGFRND